MIKNSNFRKISYLKEKEMSLFLGKIDVKCMNSRSCKLTGIKIA